MRPLSSTPILLSLVAALANSHVVLPASRPTSTPSATAIVSQPTSMLDLGRIEDTFPIQTAKAEHLDLRQVPAAQPVAQSSQSSLSSASALPDPAVQPDAAVKPDTEVEPDAADAAAKAEAEADALAAKEAEAKKAADALAAAAAAKDAADRVDPNAAAVPPVPAAPANKVDPNAAGEPISATRTDSVLVTVQWMETHITMPKTTSTTWVPVTVTIRFEAVMEQAPQPGKGSIGYGTITEAKATGAAEATLGPVGGRIGVMGVVGGVFGLGMFGMG